MKISYSFLFLSSFSLYVLYWFKPQFISKSVQIVTPKILFCSCISEKEATKVLIVATIAWGLRKCSRAIVLGLIFLIARKPGFIHAVYSKSDKSPFF